MIKTVLSAALILTTASVVAFADTTKPRHASGQKANATFVTHTSATTKGGSGATANAKRGAAAAPMKPCIIGHPAAGCF